MKVLIIQTAFIGDVILATPVISELHRCQPGFTIDVLVRKGNESLLQNFPGIRQVLIWDKRTSKTRELISTLFKIRKEKYDIVINLQRFGSTGLLTAFSSAKTRIGFDKNPFAFAFTRSIPHEIGEDNYRHETQRNLELIADYGVNLSARPELYPSAADFDKIKPYTNQQYFCIAPTSVWYTKQVPAANWTAFILQLHARYPQSTIYLLGGPGDNAACDEILQASLGAKVVNLAGALSFLQTAALMKTASMNFVNDSAPLHICSAMDAPVTAFFCSTVPAFGFGPLSTQQTIVEVKGLSCRPCGLHGYKSCPQGHFKCAHDLDMTSALPHNEA